MLKLSWPITSSLALLALFAITASDPLLHLTVKAALLILVFLSPLILHEAAHAAVLVRHRIPIQSITFGAGAPFASFKPPHLPFTINFAPLPFSASVQPNPSSWLQAPHSSKITSALAGPAFNLWAAMLLHILIDSLSPLSPQANTLRILAGAHLSFALLNLIPIAPLDGFVALTEWHHSKFHTPLHSSPYYKKLLRIFQLSCLAVLFTILSSWALAFLSWLQSP